MGRLHLDPVHPFFPSSIEVIAFDADDTLWDCQSHFEQVERALYDALSTWCTAEEAASSLFSTEQANMSLLGYGSKAFTLSVLETALRVSDNAIDGDTLSRLHAMGKHLSEMPAIPLPGVVDTLTTLCSQWQPAAAHRRLVAFTKGELLEQQNKMSRSTLLPFFDHVEIVSSKGERECEALCRHLKISPSQMLMVGNSFKSDISPALTVGCWAAYIPFHVVWQLERSEEYSHPRLARLSSISQLPALLQC